MLATKDERMEFVELCEIFISLYDESLKAGGTALTTLRLDRAVLSRYRTQAIDLDQQNDDALPVKFGALSIGSSDVRTQLKLEEEHMSPST